METEIIKKLVDDILYLAENEVSLTRYNQNIIEQRILTNAKKIKDYVKDE